MTKPSTVTSIHGNHYRLDHELGRGGQGSVFAVEGGRLAVKLLRDRSARAREALRDQLAMVGRLPLEDLDVARPIELLRPPHVGYVMELYTGMVSLGTLLRPPKKATSIVQWYFDGGGLRRRLRLLARTAEVLSELHGRGLVYVDPSPHNVFVSEHRDAAEVRLIDTDNLRTATAVGRTLYTRGYGAPEIVTQRGIPSSLSDSHAFAVIAFEALALVHPLLGDAVRDGAPEMEDQALAGRLPWIDDDDESNRSSDGISRDVVMSQALRDDFRRAFTLGLRNPTERPGLSRWAEHLHRAADRTVVCPDCSGSYYYNFAACPWCDSHRPKFIIAATLLWDPRRSRGCKEGEIKAAPGLVREPSGKLRVVDAVAISPGQTVELTDRITHGTSNRTARLRISFTDDRLTFKALDGERWCLVSSDSRHERHLASRPLDVAISDTGIACLIHCGPKDRLHRVIRFDLRPGGAR